MKTEKKYPDVTELFKLREERRKRLENLPVEEKKKISEQLSELYRKVREARQDYVLARNEYDEFSSNLFEEKS